MAEEQLTRRTVSALKWTYGSALASLVPQIIYTTIIARLLEPEAFGLIALAQVFLRFGGYFAQLGVGQAIVQKEEITDRDLRAAFTSTLLLGLLVAGIVAALAPLAVDLFESEDVVPVIRVLGMTFVVDGVGRTAFNVLRRDLRFATLARIEVPSYVLAYLGVGLGLAAAGAGVWSLVAASMAQAGFVSLFSYLAVRHPVRLTFAVAEFRALYSFGGRVTLIGFVQFIGNNLDVLFIGRYRTESELGQFNRGTYLVVVPFTELVSNLANVLYPAFSRIQSDLQRLRDAYLSAQVLLAAILIPTAVGMAVASDELVRVVLGEGWGLAAAVVPALALVQAVAFLTHLPGITAEAMARLNEKILIDGVALVVALGLFGFLASRGAGVVGYAWASLVIAFGKQVAYLVLMRRILPVTWTALLLPYAGPIATGLLVGGVIQTATWALGELGAPVLVILVVQVTAGVVVLAASAVVGPLRPARRELRDRLSVSEAFGTGRAAVALERILTFGDRELGP